MISHEHWFELLNDNTDVPMFVKDGHGVMILANKAMEKLLGMSQDELLGSFEIPHNHPEHTAQWKKNDDLVRSTQKAHVFKEHGPTKNGERYFVCYKFPINDLPEHPDAIGCIAIEVTELAHEGI